MLCVLVTNNLGNAYSVLLSPKTFGKWANAYSVLLSSQTFGKLTLYFCHQRPLTKLQTLLNLYFRHQWPLTMLPLYFRHQRLQANFKAYSVFLSPKAFAKGLWWQVYQSKLTLLCHQRPLAKFTLYFRAPNFSCPCQFVTYNMLPSKSQALSWNGHIKQTWQRWNGSNDTKHTIRYNLLKYDNKKACVLTHKLLYIILQIKYNNGNHCTVSLELQNADWSIPKQYLLIVFFESHLVDCWQWIQQLIPDNESILRFEKGLAWN